MEGLGVGSGGVLWPFLATSTCVNKGRSALGSLRAFRETRTDTFEFMCEVGLSAALPEAPASSIHATFREQPPVRCPPAGGTGSPHGSYMQQAYDRREWERAAAFHPELA